MRKGRSLDKQRYFSLYLAQNNLEKIHSMEILEVLSTQFDSYS